MKKYKGMINMKLLRVKKNMTQGELAEKAGVKRMTISYYETGLRYPRREILDKLADALGCDVKDIV